MNNRAKLRQRINNTRKILKGRLQHMSVDEVIDHATLLADYAFELGRNDVYSDLLGEMRWTSSKISHYEKPEGEKDEG